MLLVLLGISMVPVWLALRVTGDLAAGFTIALRYRLLGVVTGDRVVRVPRATAPPAPSHAAPTPPPAGAPDRHPRTLADRARLAARVLRSRAARIERPHGRVEFALGDPGETGRAFGFACALATLADPRRAIALQPSWTEQNWLAVDLALDVRVVPLRLALVVAPDFLARRHAAAPTAPRTEPSPRAA